MVLRLCSDRGDILREWDDITDVNDFDPELVEEAIASYTQNSDDDDWEDDDDTDDDWNEEDDD